MFESIAICKYDEKTDVLRAEIPGDLDKYYKILFEKENWNLYKMWCGRYGAHITIFNSLFTNHKTTNWPQRFDGDTVTFYYNPEEIYDGGHFRGFIGFYLPVYSPDIDKIRKYLGLEETLTDTLHLSLFNNKKSAYEK